MIKEEKGEFEQDDDYSQNSAKGAKHDSISSLSISQESQDSNRGNPENN